MVGKNFIIVTVGRLLMVLVSSIHFVSASFSKPIVNVGSPATASRNIPVSPECAFPRLKERLVRMISLYEPAAFDVILHSECRGQIDVLHREYMNVFEHLLQLSVRKDVTVFVKLMMQEEAYSPLMLAAWSGSKLLLPINYLEIFKTYLKHPDGSIIYWLSLKYPIESPERSYFAHWLVELQRSTLKWPFEQTRRSTSSRRSDKSTSTTRSLSPSKSTRRPAIRQQSLRSLSPLKSKSSLKSNPISWSQFENVPGTRIESDSKPSSLEVDDQIILNETPEDSSQLVVTPAVIPILNFGHIYGWISRKGNPIVRNSNQPFNFYGHSVSVHDTFLGFASSKFNLEEFAEASHTSKSFFIKSNSALSQRIKSSSSKNFAVCRLTVTESSYELQTILKGDLNLVVLSALTDGRYDFKYPNNPYQELKKNSPKSHTVTLPISASDIVLFLPRTLFIDKDNSISPHDIAGAFHYTDLSSFATSFVNFINFVYMKTSLNGLIAVGGFVHEPSTVKKLKH